MGGNYRAENKRKNVCKSRKRLLYLGPSRGKLLFINIKLNEIIKHRRKKNGSKESLLLHSLIFHLKTINPN